jgi:hypothetical protein
VLTLNVEPVTGEPVTRGATLFTGGKNCATTAAVLTVCIGTVPETFTPETRAIMNFPTSALVKA